MSSFGDGTIKQEIYEGITCAIADCELSGYGIIEAILEVVKHIVAEIAYNES